MKTLLKTVVAAVISAMLMTPLSWAVELEEMELFFELNDTDGDLGIHGKFDGEEWKVLKILTSDDDVLLDLSIYNNLQEQGLTELFFESAEPTFDDLDPMDFFNRFPEGTYIVEGMTLGGAMIEGEVDLSHVIPAAPADIMLSYEVPCHSGNGMGPHDKHECDETIEMPPAEFDAEDELVCVELEGLAEEEVTISWGEVMSSHATLGIAGDVNPVYYEVVIETEVGEDDDELEIDSSTLLPPDVTEFEFPEEYFELAEEFKFEILVRDENGNKSATEGCFEIISEDDEDE
ncbi:hypothetical protein RI844_11970 [Thalassotalea fonticola]|uniref:DUF4382 domain-containing protein n=1 Tax=Thalassotalea fonticola TaxID=3065649 RepID=A0ABZ0GJQ3_9GAMM|nr:hypothetical protein RI844_11970 [Colwelliaceae bacterium S1-1]